MAKLNSLEKIQKDIEKALARYNKDAEWQAYDTALVSLCRPLNNNTIKTVLPKIVSVDRLYKADLIRYLPKPEDEDKDVRPGLYVELARAIKNIGLDDRFDNLIKQSSRLTIHCLEEIVNIHTDVARAVTDTIGRGGDVFASKLLHFCRQEYFPILDQWAEETTAEILELHDAGGNNLITERFGYDEAEGKYNSFCRAVLAIQAALASKGLGQYSLSEIDRYLYGD